MSADPAEPSATTAGVSTAVSASPPATAVAQAVVQDLLAEDMEATAMSIDTPSYARSLGMGQPGSSKGFAGGIFHPPQDLAQSMSLDGSQAMQFGAPLNPGGSVRNVDRKDKRSLCVSAIITRASRGGSPEHVRNGVDSTQRRHEGSQADMCINAACPKPQQPSCLQWLF